MWFTKRKMQVPFYKFGNYIIGGAGMRKPVKHDELIPENVHEGPSGLGKTNVLFNLIFDPNGPRFKNIYVFSKFQ